MSLIDLLRDGAENVPPSHLPTAAELQGILGALMVYVEHGADAFEKAAEAGHQGFVDLFHPAEAQQRAADAAAQLPPDPRDGEIAQLQAQIAALQGAQQATVGTVTPGNAG